MLGNRLLQPPDNPTLLITAPKPGKDDVRKSVDTGRRGSASVLNHEGRQRTIAYGGAKLARAGRSSFFRNQQQTDRVASYFLRSRGT
jgi:hypothetical protein